MTRFRVCLATVTGVIIFIVFIGILYSSLYPMAESYDRTIIRKKSRDNVSIYRKYTYTLRNDVSVDEDTVLAKGSRMEAEMIYFGSQQVGGWFVSSAGEYNYRYVSYDDLEEADEIRAYEAKIREQDKEAFRKGLLLTIVGWIAFFAVEALLVTGLIMLGRKHPPKLRNGKPQSHPVLFGILEGIGVFLVPLLAFILFINLGALIF